MVAPPVCKCPSELWKPWLYFLLVVAAFPERPRSCFETESSMSWRRATLIVSKKHRQTEQASDSWRTKTLALVAISLDGLRYVTHRIPWWSFIAHKQLPTVHHYILNSSYFSFWWRKFGAWNFLKVDCCKQKRQIFTNGREYHTQLCE